MLTLTNCTLSGNSATGSGGGLLHTGRGTATLTNCTVAGNSADDGGGVSALGAVTLNNTIVAYSSSGGDVSGDVAGSHNLIQDGSGGLADTITGDPMLGPLADNGGPTLTRALLPGSPAIDAGDDTLAVDANGNPLAFDQRGLGFPRFVGRVDIGAFELSPRDRVEFLVTQIDDLIAGGSLNSGQGAALKATLQAALQQIDRDKISVAINDINAFIKKVPADVKAGILTEAEGGALIDAAGDILASLMI